MARPAQRVAERGQAVGDGQRPDQSQHRQQVGAPRHQVVVDQHAGELRRQQRQQGEGHEQRHGGKHPAQVAAGQDPQPARHGGAVGAGAAHAGAGLAPAAAGGAQPFVGRVVERGPLALQQQVETARECGVARRVAHGIARQGLAVPVCVVPVRGRLRYQPPAAHHVVGAEPARLLQGKRAPVLGTGLLDGDRRFRDHGPAVAEGSGRGQVRRHGEADLGAVEDLGQLCRHLGGKLVAQPHSSVSTMRSTPRSRRV